MYNGIPVMGGELVVNMTLSGKLISMNGEVSPNLSLNTTPSIFPPQAIEAAKEIVSRTYGIGVDELAATEPQLWIFDENLLMPGKRPVELVWRMDIESEMGWVRELVLVNAQTGDVSLHFNQIDGSLPVEETPPTEEKPADVPADIPTEEPPVETPFPIETEGVLETSIATPALAENFPIPTDFANEDVTALTGVNRYVAPAGVNSGNCDVSSAPCGTISYAINKAVNGDTLMVMQGVYSGSPGNLFKQVNLLGGWNEDFSS